MNLDLASDNIISFEISNNKLSNIFKAYFVIKHSEFSEFNRYYEETLRNEKDNSISFKIKIESFINSNLIYDCFLLLFHNNKLIEEMFIDTAIITVNSPVGFTTIPSSKTNIKLIRKKYEINIPLDNISLHKKSNVLK